MKDPLDLLVCRIAEAFIGHGIAPISSYMEAEDLTLSLLAELEREGAPVAHYLKRVKVYHLKDRGVSPGEIAARLGIHKKTVHLYYRLELQRRRRAA